MSSADSNTKDPKAYGQWVTMYIKNSGSKDMKIMNLDVSWGKLFADGERLPTSTYEGYVIHPGEELQMNACGRESSPSGTTGDFDVVDVPAGDKVIRHFYWDCPWGSSTNTWTISGSNSNWMVESKGANLSGGALGTIYTEGINKS
ncbi:pleurotolysin A [Cerioporus squamosus]|nr:pleurotolysin A [Cerioporus squamosus]